MGGKILAESELGAGTTFTIRLPASSEASKVTETRIAPPAVADHAREPRKVLIIDDDPSVRDLLTRGLQKRDFVVICALDGREGIRMAIESEPSVIVLDVLLPDLDGWTVFRTLRAHPRFHETLVLVHTISDVRPADLSLHATEFIQKPVSPDQLVAILRRHSTIERSQGPADSTHSEAMFLEPEGAQVLVRVVENTPETIALELKLGAGGTPETIGLLAASRDWKSIPLRARRNPPESVLGPLVAALEPKSAEALRQPVEC
jgi:CheY-like chemotaxis protein